MEERNRDEAVAGAAPPPPTVTVTRHAVYDVEGRLGAITDPLGRAAFTRVHDRLGRVLRPRRPSTPATRSSCPTPAGSPSRRSTPGVSRPSGAGTASGASPASGRAPGPASRSGSAEVVVYGDGGDPASPPPRVRPRAQANSLGRLVRRLDGAGLHEIGPYDFKGRVVESRRRPIREQVLVAASAAGAPFAPATPDWSAAGAEADLLDAETFVTGLSYDAFDRVTVRLLPSDDAGRAEAALRVRGDGRARESVALNGEPVVRRMSHDPPGSARWSGTARASSRGWRTTN